jgi:hypothetical protein
MNQLLKSARAELNRSETRRAQAAAGNGRVSPVSVEYDDGDPATIVRLASRAPTGDGAAAAGADAAGATDTQDGARASLPRRSADEHVDYDDGNPGTIPC